jgi:UPF0716 protein FxsA
MKALVLLALPFAEIYLTFFVVGKFVGGWMLLLWFVMAFMVGRQIMRGATKVIMPQMQQAQHGQTPDLNNNVLSAFCLALAGFLFIFPGVLTDIFATLLLLPPIQKLFFKQMQSALQARSGSFMTMGMGGMGGFAQGQSPFGQAPFGQSPFGGRSPFDQSNVVEGEARDITPTASTPDEPKRIELQKPANDN